MSLKVRSYKMYWPNCPDIRDMPANVQTLPNDIWQCILDYFRDPEIAQWTSINEDEVDIDYGSLYRIGQSMVNPARDWEEQRAKDPRNPEHILVQQALEAMRTNPVIVAMEEYSADENTASEDNMDVTGKRSTTQWWKVVVNDITAGWKEEGWSR